MKPHTISARRVVLGLTLAAALFAQAHAGPSARQSWDGQYESDVESEGGNPFHNTLILHSTAGKARVILNGKELSNVVITTNGFHGTLGGKPGSFTFGHQDKTNAFWLEELKSLAWDVITLETPLVRTCGPEQAAATFKRAKEAMRQYDQFLRDLHSAQAAPASEFRRRLQPLVHLQPEKSPAGNGEPEKYGPITRLTDELVAKLRRGNFGTAHCARSASNGPFVYLLCPAPCLDGDGPMFEVRQVNGKFRITARVCRA